MGPTIPWVETTSNFGVKIIDEQDNSFDDDVFDQYLEVPLSSSSVQD
jgi:hypothetical protein